MKLPNSYGSVYKLSGKRRKPWAVRKTVGWKQIPEKKKSYPIYEFIGYYATRAEALQALASYNEDPYDLHMDTITFAEVYEKWSEIHYETIKNSNGYKAAFKMYLSIEFSVKRPSKIQSLFPLIWHLLISGAICLFCYFFKTCSIFF